MRATRRATRVTLVVGSRVALIAATLALTIAPIVESSLGAPSSSAASAHDTTAPYPVGTPDASEPSGDSPPAADAMAGYTQRYANDFTGTSLPSGWDAFSGQPAGDPGAQWAKSHVAVGGGLLQLNAYQDAAYNGEWVTGGLCQCGAGQAQTYGAYFVRSRMTGAGPTQVELLWPTSGWPPEVDFDETYGASNYSMATLHFGSANNQIHNTVTTDMTQWHTWGVIWTPTSITYTLDGVVWGSVTTAADVPQQPMTLDIQQQTYCSTNEACPTSPESTDVDWVAEYGASSGTSATTTTTTKSPTTTTTTAPKPPTTTTTTTKSPTTTTTTTTTNPVSATSTVTPEAVAVTPFAANSATLSTALRAQIASLAAKIARERAHSVVLTGYAAVTGSKAKALVLSDKRAHTVASLLERLLSELHVSRVRIKVVAGGTSKPVPLSASAQLRAKYRSVIADLS